MKVLRLVLVVAAAVVALAGCGDDQGRPAPPTRTAANGEVFNDADVAFATEMVQHQAQALAIVDQTMGRRLDPEVHRLVEAIRMAQGPQIEVMTGWLTDWGRPVPETVRDHANAHRGQVDELEAASDADFQRAFLTLMVEHHEDAVEMALDERRDGVHPGAVALAEEIAAARVREIARMRELVA